MLPYDWRPIPAHAFTRPLIVQRSPKPSPAHTMPAATVAAESPHPRIEFVDHPDHLSAEAKSLMAVTETMSVECGNTWFELQSRHVLGGQGGGLWMSLINGQACRAVWPLQARREGQPAGALSNYYTALYAPSHAESLTPDELLLMARALRGGPLDSGTLYFAPMDPGSREFRQLEEAFKRAGFATARYFRFINWYLPCENMRWEDYFAARKSALRNTIRRTGKKLSSQGGVIEIIKGGAELGTRMDEFASVYASSWKQAEPFPGFIRALMQASADRGWLRLAIARLEGKAIAAQFWIVASGRAEIFKVAYDEAYKSHAAGTLLTAALMEHVLEVDKVKEVDYLIGDDAYKKLWMSHSRERWGLVAFDPRTLSGLSGMLRHGLGLAFRRLRKPMVSERTPQP